MDDDPDVFHVYVTDWSAIDAAPERVSGRDKQQVADLFRTTDWKWVAWVPTWKLNEEAQSIATVQGSDHLCVGHVEDYSDKAWRFTQPHRKDEVTDYGCYLPKSAAVIFERADNLEDLDTPQARLGDFAT